VSGGRAPASLALLLALAALACARADERSTGDDAPAMLSHEVEFQGQPLHVRIAGPEDGRAVLLLHGQAFHSGTWEELGTLEVLADAGLRAVAVDVLGFGRSPAADVDRERFLELLVPALGLQRPVIVAPSMGGVFALPQVAAHPGDVAGLVAIAPAGIGAWAPRIVDSPVPALIVWGTADTVFPISEADVLAGCFAEARVLRLQDARHPAYLDRPDDFHAAVLEFIAGLPR
jgi:abhydrolase domain-containing protein 14